MISGLYPPELHTLSITNKNKKGMPRRKSRQAGLDRTKQRNRNVIPKPVWYLLMMFSCYVVEHKHMWANDTKGFPFHLHGDGK